MKNGIASVHTITSQWIVNTKTYRSKTVNTFAPNVEHYSINISTKGRSGGNMKTTKAKIKAEQDLLHLICYPLPHTDQ